MASLQEINDILPGNMEVTEKLDADKLNDLLMELSEEHPKKFSDIANKLRRKGMEHIYEQGFSVGLDDLEILEGRDKIVRKGKQELDQVDDENKEEVSRIGGKYGQEIEERLSSQLEKSDNNFFKMVNAGARGSMNQLRQMMASPFMLKNPQNEPVPMVIDKSYAEGLELPDYWTGLYGARKGVIDRRLAQAKPGEISKMLIKTVNNQTISKKNCGTDQGVSKSIDNKSINGRVLAEPVGDIASAGTTLDQNLVQQLRKSGHENVTIRSPLTCEAKDGICQKCYGFDEFGDFPDVGDNVGVKSGQALGEPISQMSIPGNENIKIKNEDGVQNPDIGELVDKIIESSNSVTVNEDHEVAPAPEGLKTIGINENEKTDWTSVQEVSRHPSPDTILSITTETERSFSATEDQSFIVRRNNKISAVNGNELTIGDWIPFAVGVDTSHDRKKLDLKKWTGVPHGNANRLSGGEFELDFDSGFLIGLFLAEGSVLKNVIEIAGYDDESRQIVIQFLEKNSIDYNVLSERKGKPYAIRFSCKPLENLLLKTCYESGFENNCRYKKVPRFAYDAKNGFINGLVDAYFHGDGSVGGQTIRAFSTSKKLLLDFSSLLAQYGVYTTFYQPDSEKDGWTLRIPKKYANRFSEEFSITGKTTELANLVCNPTKNDCSDIVPNFGDLLQKMGNESNNTIDNLWSATERQRIGKKRLERIYDKLVSNDVKNKEPFQEAQKIIESNVVWQQISSIKKTEPPTEYVYDLSIESDIDSFCLENNLILHNTMNTFHSGGVVQGPESQDVIQGLPRIDQLLSMPNSISDEAAIAEQTGKVDNVEGAESGGLYVDVVNEDQKKSRHFVAPDQDLLVDEGEEIKRADKLSTGIPDPSKMVNLVGINETRKRLTDELKSAYEGFDIDDGIFETVVRGVTDLVRVKDPGDSDEYVPGDYASFSDVHAKNQEEKVQKPVNDAVGDPAARDYNTRYAMVREGEEISENQAKQLQQDGIDQVEVAKDPIKFRPEMKGINSINNYRPDWLTRIGFNRIQQALEEGVSQSHESELHGYDPIPGFAYGSEFGEQKLPGGY